MISFGNEHHQTFPSRFRYQIEDTVPIFSNNKYLSLSTNSIFFSVLPFWNIFPVFPVVGIIGLFVYVIFAVFALFVLFAVLTSFATCFCLFIPVLNDFPSEKFPNEKLCESQAFRLQTFDLMDFIVEFFESA